MRVCDLIVLLSFVSTLVFATPIQLYRREESGDPSIDNINDGGDMLPEPTVNPFAPPSAMASGKRN
jgi:hypothetical protein